ncbi:MAG: hypothetical protein HON53_24710 [Planctomycetaceae bacterium]|jgi:chromosome segregation ATPase|nr:hypothetical protein [Planctomycetaceae bacterium]MBT6156559.1 hypothetical protein [Planctomycetaceae bacterium]MBT6483815.1 hypothetical protein [Planctomycetaceae bacterium]MBT6496694.1 hypothetical protein [Planctomycetaceae bacterium]
MKTGFVPAYTVAFALLACCLPADAQDSPEGGKKKPPKITYDEHVKPILRAKCFSCHNADKKKGDLDLTTYTGLMQGGGSGEVIEAGESGLSYLYGLITHDEEPFMPPSSPKIDDKMIETIRKWIDGGVLENSGSKAKLSDKPKFNLALKTAPSERPATVPMPGRLSLEPAVYSPTTTAVTALATSPWAPLAAVAGQKQVLLYNTSTFQLLGALPFPEGVPQVLKFSRNGSLLLAGGGRGGEQGLAVVWNIKTGERIIEIGDELDTVLAADISSDQTLIALGGPQKVVRIYSTETGRLLHELRKHTDWICSLEFSPDSVLLATGDRNGGLFVWEGWTGREYLALKAHSKMVTAVSWRSDSNVVASCSEDGSIRLWEMENGGQIKSWGAHGGGVGSVEFARDGRIVSCGRDRVTKLWNQAGAQQRAFEAFGDLALRVTFCDETNRAIAGDWTGAIRVWNAADGKRLGELAQNPLPLEQRLKNATAQLTANRAANDKSVAATKAAEAVVAKINADLAAAKKATTDAQALLTSSVAAAKVYETNIAKVTGEIAAATKVVAAVTPVVPLLQETLTKGQQTAAKAATDKELAAVVVQLKTLLDKRKATLAAAQKVATDKTAELNKTKTQLATTQKQATDSKAAVDAGNKRTAALTPTLKPAQDKLAAARTASAATTQKFAASEKEVARWQDEIAFTRKIVELKKATAVHYAERSAGDELVAAADEANAAVAKINADLAAAKKATTDAQTQNAAALAAAKQYEAAIAKVTAEATAAGKVVAAVAPAVPLLQESLTKGQQAAAKATADKELAAAVNQLKTLLDKRKAEMVAAQKTVTDKTAELNKTKGLLATSQKQAAVSKAAVDAGNKRTAVLTPTLKPAQDKSAAAKAAAAVATQKVAAAEKEVARLQNEIAAASQLAQVTAPASK